MKNPIQPLAKDTKGVLRFKENTLVRALLDHGQATGLGLNDLACMKSTPEYADDWQQLAQIPDVQHWQQLLALPGWEPVAASTSSSISTAQ